MLYQIRSRIKVESLMKGACRLVQQCGSVCSSFWATGGFIDFGYAFKLFNIIKWILVRYIKNTTRCLYWWGEMNVNSAVMEPHKIN